ncbi:MAG: D-aminoacyl-tRNA deacylase [candidate division WOR-3 bacterium]
MRALLQRVKRAAVRVGGNLISEIGPGVLVLLGVGANEDEAVCCRLAAQVAKLRIFDDTAGKMNLSLLEVGGAALVVPQFTLYADTTRGLRPFFGAACEPGRARELYERFIAEVARLGVETRTGSFGARMDVELVNDGPVTIMLEASGDRG